MKKPACPPKIEPYINDLLSREGGLSVLKCNITDHKGRYLHWDKLRFLPTPEGHSSEQWWASIKFARKQMYKCIGISDPEGKQFVFLHTDEMLETLHWLDQNASGMIGSHQPIVNSQMKNTYLIRSLIEEAITSSQLEGASTTWRVAKEMLRQERKPSDKNEQMIYNNYIAMQFIREFKQEKLTSEMLLELQKILTEDTLEEEHHAGCFRTMKDDVSVVSDRGDTLHIPPAANLLTQRINNVCHFANEITSQPFIHPIIKSIILHFLLGYEHPFVDGNGRTARALFYWSAAQQNYWLMEFISISRIIKKAPLKYGKAYLYTESDENDLTYFIIYQLEIIKEAINDLYIYIDKKSKEIASAEELFLSSAQLRDRLNYRQLALIKHAMKHPGFIYKIAEHQNSHGIAYQTARTDLLDLSDKFNFLNKETKGKGFIFRSPHNLADKIQAQSKK